MSKSAADAIVALATPSGASERAVFRLSGRDLLKRASKLLPVGWPNPGQQRQVLSGSWTWMPGCELQVSLLVFPGPKSSTGEDVLELHLPGSAPVVQKLQDDLLAAGLRLAEPGEFTRRAFLNGKIDLSQAEAVLDLVNSSTSHQAQAAAAVLAGSLGKELQSARDSLTHALVQLEASLDFEEGDSQDLSPAEITDALQTASDALERGNHSEKQRAVELGAFWRIALVGEPNAGKTSLFHALTGKKALVSDVAGTTRDRLQAEWQPEFPSMEIPSDATRPWLLCDLPGLGGDAVDERDAAARRRVQRDTFDMQWLVLDGSASHPVMPTPLPDLPTRVLISKADLPRQISTEVLAEAARWGEPIWVSAAKATGLENLAPATLQEYQTAERQHSSTLRSVERHRQTLDLASQAVHQAQSWLRTGGSQDLVAEEIRGGLLALAELVGEFTPEDLLDQLFGDFCVGK